MLARLLPDDRALSEAEVNVLLNQVHDDHAYLRRMLVDLPQDQRQVIELAYFHGLTQAEIAARVSAPIGTVKGRMRLGLAKLQRAFA